MLHHVTLEVARDDADRFAELLGAIGFVPVPIPETLGDGFRWLERDGTQVHLAIVAAPVAPPRGHAAFVVAPLEPALQRLAGLGFAVEDRQRHWDARRVVVTAPGGHLVELIEAPPGPA
jgi:hypothetical protein